MDIHSIAEFVSKIDVKLWVGILSFGGVIYTVHSTRKNTNNTNDLKKEIDEQTRKLTKELGDQTHKLTKELGEKNLKALEQRRYIDAISTERIKWINTMRDKFSEFTKFTYVQMTEFSRWKEKGFDTSDQNVRDELRDRIFEITYIRNQITLLLNPIEPVSQKLIKLQNTIARELSKKDNIPEFEFKYWAELMGDLEYFHQVVLKAEWKRVKKENKKGEEIDDKEMSHIYTEVAKKLNNKRYNKYFGQPES